MEQERPHSDPAEAAFTRSAAYSSPYKEDNETLGTHLVDAMAGAVKRLWRTSYTALSIDLRRASISYEGPPLFRRSQGKPPRVPRGTIVANSNSYQDPNTSAPGPWGRRVEAAGAQARLKVMQVWELKNRSKRMNSSGNNNYEDEVDDDPWRINLGIGGKFELEGGQLKPKLRLRAKYASLHILPEPMIELRRRWPLPPPTNLGIDIRCRIPLSSPDRLSESISGARLMVSMFKLKGGYGIHFTPGGLLFEENVIDLGRYTKMRIAAALEFPRELPWNEDDKPFKLEIRRVGIKARTL